MRQRQLPELGFEPTVRSWRAKTQACPARRPISLATAYLVRVAGRDSSGVRWSAITFIAGGGHISYICIYMPRPYLYLILSLQRHLATTSDPMRWRGSSAEHVCWRRSAVRWALGRTGPFRCEPGPSLHLRPLGRDSSAARGATAIRAGALEASVNELIDTTFGCYSSSKSADIVPKGEPTIWHKITACHLCSCTSNAVTFDPLVRLASPIVLGAPWMGT
jgi:hypothetical protein